MLDQIFIAYIVSRAASSWPTFYNKENFTFARIIFCFFFIMFEYKFMYEGFGCKIRQKSIAIHSFPEYENQ